MRPLIANAAFQLLFEGFVADRGHRNLVHWRAAKIGGDIAALAPDNVNRPLRFRARRMVRCGCLASDAATHAQG
jgi:hypothetical protein